PDYIICTIRQTEVKLDVFCHITYHHEELQTTFTLTVHVHQIIYCWKGTSNA
ncbi:unnamed protein product, partial [Musa hybrid cultivar]